MDKFIYEFYVHIARRLADAIILTFEMRYTKVGFDQCKTEYGRYYPLISSGKVNQFY